MCDLCRCKEKISAIYWQSPGTKLEKQQQLQVVLYSKLMASVHCFDERPGNYGKSELFVQCEPYPVRSSILFQRVSQDAFNVIVVDWQHGATVPYEQATANTRVVGAQIAKLINKLISLTGAQASDFHIIGHSLGAHVAGYAGERVTHLGRITGNV